MRQFFCFFNRTKLFFLISSRLLFYDFPHNTIWLSWIHKYWCVKLQWVHFLVYFVLETCELFYLLKLVTFWENILIFYFFWIFFFLDWLVIKFEEEFLLFLGLDPDLATVALVVSLGENLLVLTLIVQLLLLFLFQLR